MGTFIHLEHYRTLGRLGLRVSPLCLGTMTFGEDLGPFGASVETSRALIDRYLDGGSAGRTAVFAACEASLRRLDTDYFDLYRMHTCDRHIPIEETLAALDALVHSGKVRSIGVSDTPAWKVAQAQTLALLRQTTLLIALQLEYFLLERTVEGQLTPMAVELGLGVTPWSPLRGGLLTEKNTRGGNHSALSARVGMLSHLLTERTFALIDILVAVAREVSVSASSVALAWLSAQPGVVGPIFGARTMAQLEDNLAAGEVALSGDQMARLAAASAPQVNVPAAFLTLAGQVIHGGIRINSRRPEATMCSPRPGGSIF